MLNRQNTSCYHDSVMIFSNLVVLNGEFLPIDDEYPISSRISDNVLIDKVVDVFGTLKDKVAFEAAVDLIFLQKNRRVFTNVNSISDSFFYFVHENMRGSLILNFDSVFSIRNELIVA